MNGCLSSYVGRQFIEIKPILQNFSDPGGEIEWDKTTQGWVLSAFFYGYLITQVPSGIIAGRYGGKRVVLVSLSLYSVTNMLIPVAAR